MLLRAMLEENNGSNGLVMLKDDYVEDRHHYCVDRVMSASKQRGVA